MNWYRPARRFPQPDTTTLPNQSATADRQRGLALSSVTAGRMARGRRHPRSRGGEMFSSTSSLVSCVQPSSAVGNPSAAAVPCMGPAKNGPVARCRAYNRSCCFTHPLRDDYMADVGYVLGKDGHDCSACGR